MILYRGLGQTSGIVQQIASAITRQENTNPAYNNPGGLVSGPGQVGTAPNGIAIFPDLATGQAAEVALVQKYVDQGMTLSQLINTWAPAGCGTMCTGNQPSAYTQNVASWTGIDPNTPLSSLMSGGAGSTWDTTAPTPTVDFSTVFPDLSSIDPSSFLPLLLVGLGGLAIFALSRR